MDNIKLEPTIVCLYIHEKDKKVVDFWEKDYVDGESNWLLKDFIGIDSEEDVRVSMFGKNFQNDGIISFLLKGAKIQSVEIYKILKKIEFKYPNSHITFGYLLVQDEPFDIRICYTDSYCNDGYPNQLSLLDENTSKENIEKFLSSCIFDGVVADAYAKDHYFFSQIANPNIDLENVEYFGEEGEEKFIVYDARIFLDCATEGDGYQLWNYDCTPFSPAFATIQALCKWSEKNVTVGPGLKILETEWYDILVNKFHYCPREIEMSS